MPPASISVAACDEAATPRKGSFVLHHGDALVRSAGAAQWYNPWHLLHEVSHERRIRQRVQNPLDS
jgi:hypothetical protein